MNEKAKVSCSNSECDVTETGKCVEGFPELAECPHYGKEFIEDDISKKGEGILSDIVLPSGDALDQSKANRFLCAFPANIIAVAGPADSGKTTLLSSIYDILQLGPFHDYSFATSTTLLAFERRCFLARLASQRSSPTTERTSTSSGLKFLHLALGRRDFGRVDFLLSDRSGEDYQRAANNEEACRELIELSRADIVLILVDGRKIANPQFRASAINETKMMVQAFLESGMVGEHQKLGVILTKLDLIPEASSSVFDSLVQWVKEQFDGKFLEIISIKTAARPETHTLDPYIGLKELLNECSSKRVIPKFKDGLNTKTTRAFHKGPVNV